MRSYDKGPGPGVTMPFEAGSKLDDPALLALVEEFGLDETTYPALQFIPLLYIAWSAGKIQSGEARKIRKIANQRGLASGAAGPSISYGLGQGATLVAAFWGVFIWREFKDAPPRTGRLLTLMFIFYVVGLSLIVYAGT